ncbi:hypothetical protein QBC34DRAFT_416930 [Podospora aff. communis PSN243]|uniref:JmjC domain-containing protein n=1 Tax=Podospora aff. communis PSN243 TaxID=3040156 RepID=A0AAV9G617_9PEZI|nr:hypothetical protein QBC34DRAFT_416930 [Podospora aff. communis PSN243]
MATSEKKFPGFGLPVESVPKWDESTHSHLSSPWSSSGVTLREQRMMSFINTITDKPDWETKVFDDKIVAKWREEAKVGPDDANGTDDAFYEGPRKGDSDYEGSDAADEEPIEGEEVKDKWAASDGDDTEQKSDEGDGDGNESDEAMNSDWEDVDEDDENDSHDEENDSDNDSNGDESDNAMDGNSDGGSSDRNYEVPSLADETEDVYMTPKMFNFCIAELRDKAASFKKTGQVNVLDAEVVIVKSDVAVSKDLQDELRSHIKALENVPDRQKDWHPGSDETVLDLVHPSLFPVVWGLTRALEEGTVPLEESIKLTGKGKTVDPAKKSDEQPRLWGSYQWLPAEVSYADGAAKIVSYINNLHPKQHKSLYNILETVTAATIPLWHECVNGFNDRRRFDIKNTGNFDFKYPPGLKYQIPGREGPGSLVDPNTDEPDNYDENDIDEDDDEDWRDSDEYEEWKHEHRTLVYREPRGYISQADLKNRTIPKNSYESHAPRKPVDLLAPRQNLQVIYKLANIHLTPEKPTYAGGTWHVEGTMNECIVASAIYYFDQDNITDSHLAFRVGVDALAVTMIPAQDEHESLQAYMGIHHEGPAVQPLGKVLTREGRLLVFPNVVQHQVQPFSLEDKTKPGYRKILAMFLVDPTRPILSSAHVPPQRRDWWAEELRRDGVLDTLPNEIFDLTVGMIDDFPLSWEQAVKHREILMEERSAIAKDQTREMFQEEFSFCEH